MLRIIKVQLFWEGHKNVKTIRQIAQTFVALSEKLNFNWTNFRRFLAKVEIVLKFSRVHVEMTIFELKSENGQRKKDRIKKVNDLLVMQKTM